MYMIYCEPDSMVNCTTSQLDDIIFKNTKDCIKLNERVWFTNIEKHDFLSFDSASYDFFHDYIKKYTDENSVFVIVELTHSAMYNLPISISHEIVLPE